MSREERLREAIADVLDEMDDEEFIDLYNDMARDDGYDMIYHMYDLDEVCSTQMGYTIEGFMRDLGEFSIDDEYFTVTDTNVINSFDSLLDFKSPVDRDAMINYLAETEYAFGNDSLQELFDSFAYTTD